MVMMGESISVPKVGVVIDVTNEPYMLLNETGGSMNEPDINDSTDVTGEPNTVFGEINCTLGGVVVVMELRCMTCVIKISYESKIELDVAISNELADNMCDKCVSVEITDDSIIVLGDDIYDIVLCNGVLKKTLDVPNTVFSESGVNVMTDEFSIVLKVKGCKTEY
jgi:hypothetical protein